MLETRNIFRKLQELAGVTNVSQVKRLAAPRAGRAARVVERRAARTRGG
jgi:hypothetical protein